MGHWDGLKRGRVYDWFRRSPWPVSVILVALALSNRVGRLHDPLLTDEATTLVEHIGQPPAVIVETFGTARNHPLYTLLAHGCWLISPTVASVRLPALIAGLAVVAAMGWWLRPLAGPVPAAWAAAALAVASPQALYSARARGYSMLVLGTVVTCWFLTRALEHGRKRDWLAYTAAIVLTTYAHLWGLFLLVGHGAFVVVAHGVGQRAGVNRERASIRPLVAFAAAAVGSLVLIGLLYVPMVSGIAAMLSEERETPFFPELVAALAWNWDFGLGEANFAAGGLFLFVLLASLIDGTLLRERLAWMTALPILTTLLLVAVVQPANFYPRFLLLLLPFALALFAVLLRTFPLLQFGGGESRRWCARPTLLSTGFCLVAAMLLAIAVGVLATGQATGAWERFGRWYAGFAWGALVAWIIASLCGGVSEGLRGVYRLAWMVTGVVVFVDLVPVLINVDRLAVQVGRAAWSGISLVTGLALVGWTVVQLSAETSSDSGDSK